MSNDDFNQAKRLIHEGKQRAGTRLLMDFIKETPEDEAAWWLLATTLQNRQHKVKALRRLLKINPNHHEAYDYLQQLQPAGPNDTHQTHKHKQPSLLLLGAGGSVVVIVLAIAWFVISNLLASTPDGTYLSQDDIIIFIGETGSGRAYNMNVAVIEDTAQLLVERGADVGIYIDQSGGDSQFRAYLSQDALGEADSMGDDTIALYISETPQYSAIRYGDRWTDELNPHVSSIRQDVMNPYMLEQEYTRAFTATLKEVENIIAAASVGGEDSSNDSPFPDWDTSHFIIILLLVLFFIGTLLGSTRGGGSRSGADVDGFGSSDGSGDGGGGGDGGGP